MQQECLTNKIIRQSSAMTYLLKLKQLNAKKNKNA